MENELIEASAGGAKWFAAFSPQRSTFWVALFFGAALRFYCVVFTEGTYDINDWTRHAIGVRDHGLIGLLPRQRVGKSSAVHFKSGIANSTRE